MKYAPFFKRLQLKDVCVYCGMPARGHDHFVPKSVVAVMLSVGLEVSGRVLVPCCHECNTLARNNVFATIAHKRKYIGDKLRKKYARVLSSPTWTREEMQEVSWSLQTTIIAGEVLREILHRRLRWKNVHGKGGVNIAEVHLYVRDTGRSSAL